MSWPAGYLLIFSATATEIKRVLLRLLARLRVDHDLAYRYPAIVTDVRGLVLIVVEIMISGRWMRWVRGRLIHVNLLCRLAGLREVPAPRGHLYV